MNSADKKVGVALRQQNDIAVIYIFNQKRKYCNRRCPDSVYFDTLLLIIYLSAIETCICRREMSLIGSTAFGFAQNTIHDFWRTIVRQCFHSLRITYHAYYVFGKSRAYLPPIYYNFSVSNAFLRQPAV